MSPPEAQARNYSINERPRECSSWGAVTRRLAVIRFSDSKPRHRDVHSPLATYGYPVVEISEQLAFIVVVAQQLFPGVWFGTLVFSKS